MSCNPNFESYRIYGDETGKIPCRGILVNVDDIHLDYANDIYNPLPFNHVFYYEHDYVKMIFKFRYYDDKTSDLQTIVLEQSFALEIGIPKMFETFKDVIAVHLERAGFKVRRSFEKEMGDLPPLIKLYDVIHLFEEGFLQDAWVVMEIDLDEGMYLMESVLNGKRTTWPHDLITTLVTSDVVQQYRHAGKVS